ncbi:MAG: DUF1285 domain-containing protein [Gammaproteobacteria bacterium]|uniref:DUF1285 domain-containing protein n=1 Tax=SAR86 cluster bacterium TaxID=2030880 RepID=A0A520N122_9GAMM|nr:DUF1285 domain-containing protein [SAR86 cluster bacterium]RZO27181.1 MAG: DUF1285 domain-containing protein [SAR86 cluster bacterium]|tara:strand:+ start:1026 stop:1532 length:507 start_codon:yes stop_codon:yes gene_type:complete
MDINKIEKDLLGLDDYPLEQWNPPLCEGVEFTLDDNSRWFYNGSEIKRLAMIKLFSKLVKLEGDEYFVVTPAEKIILKAKREIFAIIDYKKDKEDYFFKTNTNEWVKLTSINFIKVDMVNGHPYPKILLREGIWGLLSRNIFYLLISEAKQSGNKLYLTSDNKNFFLN